MQPMGAPLKFLKIGGSLVTDKSSARSVKSRILHDVCAAVFRALDAGGLSLLVGHGGGSFGHTVARDFRVAEGLPGGGGWEGFHRTRDEMIDFNRIVCAAFRDAGVNAAGVQPSSFCAAPAPCCALPGVAAIKAYLDAGAVPVVFGDAVPDSSIGFTILSTEGLFLALAPLLKPSAIIVLADVPGILADPGGNDVVPVLDRAGLGGFRAGSVRGADVTGGIESKARMLLQMAEENPGCEVRLISGLDPDAVESALLGRCTRGTLFVGPDGKWLADQSMPGSAKPDGK